MLRKVEVPRHDYQNTVKSQGLLWPENYWLENASYSFTSKELGSLERMSKDLWEMFVQAGQRIVDENLFYRFGISDDIAARIRDSWNSEPPAIYGRYDVAWNNGVPKLLEFNADTPTGLVEAAVCQWEWKQDKYGDRVDQWNNIHDYLIEKWQDVKGYVSDPVHFTCLKDALYEDWMTTAYMQEVAEQAGHATQFVPIDQIDERNGRFYDLNGKEINSIFKLYPWEWLLKENKNLSYVNWIEPIWKMMWSNKEILVILWEMFPNSPWLLKATDKDPLIGTYVQKAKLGREGKNCIIHRDGQPIHVKGGGYGVEGYIYQDFADLGNFDNNYPVLGIWAVDGTPAGMGIRESNDLITGNTSRFVPHILEN